MDIRGGWLTVNRYCNFRCRWCYATGTAFKAEDSMPFPMAKSLIDLMHELGVVNVVLIGGETLFWKHLFETATYIKSLGMTSAVVTNGWLLGNERFREKVGLSDITSLNISLKGGNRRQYAELTGFDGFDQVVDGIKQVSKWKHIGIGVSTVVSDATLGNIDELAQVAFDNGVPMMGYTLCGPTIADGDFNSQYMPNLQAVVQAFVEKYDVINAISGGNFSLDAAMPTCLYPPDFLRVLESRGQISYGCQFKSRSGVLFDRWGKVIPCNHLFDYPIGQYGVDFTDRASFQAMWERPELDAFYGKMLAYPARACVSCTAFNKCGGGCPLNWFVREPETTILTGGERWTS